MLDWFRSIRQRKQIRQDRKHLEARARRFLKSYLTADTAQKHQYYEVVAGASAACQPSFTDSSIENSRIAEAAAEVALKVVKFRKRQRGNCDRLQSMITDAYATVAIAHRRAAAIYTIDNEMQQLGTAAVHLVTMATSYMALSESEELGNLQ